MEAPPELGNLEQRLRGALDELKKNAPGMDGYYIGENGHLAAILVRTTLPSMEQRAGDLEQPYRQADRGRATTARRPRVQLRLHRQPGHQRRAVPRRDA